MYKILLSFSLSIFHSQHVFAELPLVDNIEDAIALSEHTEQPILIIFTAKWCKHCTILKQDIYNGYMSNQLDNVIVCSVDIDKYPETRTDYGVSSIPDSRYFKHKKEVSSIKGYAKKQYLEWLNNVSKL